MFNRFLYNVPPLQRLILKLEPRLYHVQNHQSNSHNFPHNQIGMLTLLFLEISKIFSLINLNPVSTFIILTPYLSAIAFPSSDVTIVFNNNAIVG